ncbi:MAG TPA: hypothetical protein VF199_02010 [Bacillales bacterium]
MKKTRLVGMIMFTVALIVGLFLVLNVYEGNGISSTTTSARAKIINKQRETPNAKTEILSIEIKTIKVKGIVTEEIIVKNKNVWNLIKKDQLYRLSYLKIEDKVPVLKEINDSKISIQQFNEELEEYKAK